MEDSLYVSNIVKNREGLCVRNSVKKFLSIILAVSFCFAFSVNAFAIQPRYIYALVISNELTVSDGQAVMYSDVSGAADITKVVMTHVLQKKSGSSYSNVRNTTFTRTFHNNPIPDMEDIVDFTGPGTYRVKTTYMVTGPRGTDTHTQYSTAVTI